MPALSLPIANRRVVEQPQSPPTAPQPESPEQPQGRFGVRARVRELLKPLLPIHSKTTRSVSLAPPEPEPDVKDSPSTSGGTTRRASASYMAVPDVQIHMMPNTYSTYTFSSGTSPSSNPTLATRTSRVQFSASPVSVKEYTPYNSQLSPWASPSALSPNGVHFMQQDSPSSSPVTAPVAPVVLFTSGSPEARSPQGQQVYTTVPQVQTVRVGKPVPVLPAAAVRPVGVVQGQHPSMTYLVPPQPMASAAAQPAQQQQQQTYAVPTSQRL